MIRPFLKNEEGRKVYKNSTAAVKAFEAIRKLIENARAQNGKLAPQSYCDQWKQVTNDGKNCAGR